MATPEVTTSLVLALALAVAAASPPAATPADAPDAHQQLAELVQRTWGGYLELNPRFATQIGDHRFDAHFGDGISAAWRSALAQLATATITAAAAVDPDALTEDERLTQRLLVEWMRDELGSLAFPEQMLVVNHFPSSPPLAFGQELAGAGPFRFVDSADYDAFLARGHDFATWVDRMVVALGEGAASGVVQPCEVVDATLAQLDSLLFDEPRASRFWGPVTSWPAAVPQADRERLTVAWEAMLTGSVGPAYRRLRRAVAEVSRPACRPGLSMRTLPDGRSWYRSRARTFTTTDDSPAALLNLGFEECRRIRTEIAELKRRQHGRSLAGSMLHGEREILAGYEAIRRRVEPRLGIVLGRLPKAPLAILPMAPVLAAAGSGAFYQPPGPDGDRPGVFLVNTSWPAYPSRSMEALFLHEALPGHHLQLALAAENPSLPAFRRHLYQGAFIEGWALYAEGLGDLLGLYADPVQRAGRLELQLRRAARLVADVGIHDLGWSRAHAERVLNDVAGGVNSDELLRYAALPGQGLTYTVGERCFVELCRRAHSELGAAFDLRAFHDEVLRHGALPLPVLTEVVARWIESRRPRPVRPPAPTSRGAGREHAPAG